MSGHTVAGDEHLIRSSLWSSQIKSLLMDDLFAMKYVRILSDFPDGTTINIPSIGEAETQNFVEGQRIKYNKLDTGNFQFSFDEYKYSANSISQKFKRDSFYSAEVLAAFVPRQHRALMEAVETRILSRGNAGQTASDLNLINGAAHRYVGHGTSEVMAVKDFSLARYALGRANVPRNNLVAIVDPSVTYAIEQLPNVINMLSPMPSAERIIREGMTTGMKFKWGFMGFDVYESNYLPRDIAETVNSVSVTTGVANLFFSAAAGDTMPIIGGFRQMPTVESSYNKDTQETEYLTIAEWGFKLYRPENMVVVLTDTDQVS